MRKKKKDLAVNFLKPDKSIFKTKTTKNKLPWNLIKIGLTLVFGLVLRRYKKKVFKPKRKTALFLILAILLSVLIIVTIWVFSLDYSSEQRMEFNISFSAPYAKDLGLDWKAVYIDMLDDLRPAKVRIPIYWNLLEPVQGRYKFEGVDWQIEKAAEYGVDVVLVIGRRVPRWPECHEPLWILPVDEKIKQPEILKLVTTEVEHFKKYDNIVMWQVENEPLFNLFGECPKISKEFLQKEVDLVKSLDSRPIMITDSGELSFWVRSGQVAEVLGTTLYRVVWNPLTSFFKHINPPFFYHGRAEWVKKHYGVKRVIISELQAEPWAVNERFISQVPLKDQYRGFSLEQFKKNVEFAKKTGLGEAYLWGAEWWYWIREVHGNDAYWEYAKKVINR